jgi:ABC-2 type transport system permease protein
MIGDAFSWETLRAAYVIARRDLTALVTSKAFIFFLIGPLILMGIGLGAATLGGHMAADSAPRPVIAAAMAPADNARLAKARDGLDHALAGLPQIDRQPQTEKPAALLREGRQGKGYAAVLSGSLDHPVLTATQEAANHLLGTTQVLIDSARRDTDIGAVTVEKRIVSLPVAPSEPDRLMTAQIAQMALFLLTMLLAGMVLSNLVEEKANKIIEILAASVPIDSIFLGKLGSMLIMAFIGIGVWTLFGSALFALKGGAMPSLPEPAIGWPVFGLLAVVYFSSAYLLLGSLFIGIGAMAATVREVQTLSMPVSMGQLAVFFLASYALPHINQPIEIAAAVFPFSSPFVMLARAAQQPAIWPHLVAILWQALWALAIVRVGTMLFRRNVLKSGPARRAPEPARAA